MNRIEPIFNNLKVKTVLPPNKSAGGIFHNQPYPISIQSKFPQIKDKNLLSALTELNEVRFNYADIMYMSIVGAKPVFASGKKAVDFMSKNNTNIIFGKTVNPAIFAQYSNSRNLIIINEKYKNPKSKAEILAISEAILHEAGHAFDKDSVNSMQEEINNLSLNVLAHKFYQEKYPGVFNNSNSPLIKDGVEAYCTLFYDSNSAKTGLKKRLKSKYGQLNTLDTKHPPGKLALEVINTRI